MKANSYLLENRTSIVPLSIDYYSMCYLWIRIGSILNGTENYKTDHIMIFMVSTFQLVSFISIEKMFVSIMNECE